MNRILGILISLTSFSASAMSFNYVCSPSMSNPDRKPWYLQVDSNQVLLGQDVGKMKSASKTKNHSLNYLIRYNLYKGEISSFTANNYLYLYLKPELVEGGLPMGANGLGGEMAIQWRDGNSFFETSYICVSN